MELLSLLIFYFEFNRFVVASGLFATEAHAQAAKGELEKAIGNFMAEPITPKHVLEKDSEDMKVKMEMLIMKIQVSLS